MRFFKIVISLTMIVILLLTFSCKKEVLSSPKIQDLTEETEETVDKAVAPWLIYLAAAAIIDVISELSSGQYQGDRVVETSEGTMVVTGGCDGAGNCAIPSKINNNGGDGDGEDLSSEDNDVDVEFTQSINGQFIKLNDGRIVYTIKLGEEGYENFFYDESINISKSYVIDNPVFFHLMDIEETPIVVGGEYIVHQDTDGQKYIVVN